MKLWRRRPLSEDLSRQDFHFPNEMPPPLVYISPGNHRISKRFSLRNNENLERFRGHQEMNPVSVSDSVNNSKTKNFNGNHHFHSFLDYESKYATKFEDNTLKSSHSTNRDCKSYFLPVSQEWSPVKDVMKICRSASVPFQSRKNVQKTDTQPNDVILNDDISKSSHVSISEKIKIFFRNRSTSRPPKQILTSIIENRSSINSDKPPSRSSRSRMKDVESCRSVYEQSMNLNRDNSDKLVNSVTMTNNSQDDSHFNKLRASKQMLTKKEKKFVEKNIHPNKKEKAERKPIIQSPYLIPESHKRVSLQELSPSVISQTVSLAAKCKINSPKTCDTDHGCQRNDRHSERNYIPRADDMSAHNFAEKTSRIYNSKHFGKFDLPNSCNRPQATVAAPPAKENVNVTRGSQIDSRGYKQQYLSNITIVPRLNGDENRAPIVDQRKYNVDYDDYVTLADVTSLPPKNRDIMTQSLYVSSDSASTKDRYENNETNPKCQHGDIHQQKNRICHKNKSRVVPVGGEIRKRPISCIAVANTDYGIPIFDFDTNDQPGIVYPKSPYLSQYSKLYSLRRNDMVQFDNRRKS